MTETVTGDDQNDANMADDSGETNDPTGQPPKPAEGALWYRRNFLSMAAWSGLLTFIGASLIGFTRFMFPRVLFEPVTIFKAGRPESYGVGEVSTQFVESDGVWVVRTSKGFFALHAVCTHLGCTPRWLEAEQKFKCPCHGTGFTKEGINFEGPAPTPLRRLRIVLADDGQLLIDRSRKFKHEKGEWDSSEAFLYV